MGSYPVKKNHIGSVVNEILLYIRSYYFITRNPLQLEIDGRLLTFLYNLIRWSVFNASGDIKFLMGNQIQFLAHQLFNSLGRQVCLSYLLYTPQYFYQQQIICFLLSTYKSLDINDNRIKYSLILTAKHAQGKRNIVSQEKFKCQTSQRGIRPSL